MLAIALFTALLGLVGPQLAIRHQDAPVAFEDLYGSERHAAAALECRPGGKPVLYLTPHADFDTVLHEFAHAYDCADDGTMNASPIEGLRPAQRPAWASDYCWTSDAEWYACWVVHAGSVHPTLGPGEAASKAPEPAATPARVATPASE